jgi:large subunit ribosomal protein L1
MSMLRDIERLKRRGIVEHGGSTEYANWTALARLGRSLRRISFRHVGLLICCGVWDRAHDLFLALKISGATLLKIFSSQFAANCEAHTIMLSLVARQFQSKAIARGSLCIARSYITRAHPKPIPEYPIPEALQTILEDVQNRRLLRQRKAERLAKAATTADPANSSAAAAAAPDATAAAHTPTVKPARILNHPDETIELVVNLNLDPRKPGQALRGSVTLPHGTGKKGMNCVVFTNDQDAVAQALAAGAAHAGGEALVDEILAGTVAVDSIQAALATPDIMPLLTKKAARLLGPRGLMPNPKVGTLLPSIPELLAALDTQLAGKEVSYRTEKEGIIHVPVGKDNFGPEKLLDNIGAVMKTIFEAKPDSYGKGKKKKSSGKKGQAKTTKQPKYLLRASLSSTQGPGVRMDLRTVDPTSAFFLTVVDPLQANKKGSPTVVIGEQQPSPANEAMPEGHPSNATATFA